MNKTATASRVTAGFVGLILVLTALGFSPLETAEANTGCPESTSSFGTQTFTGTCTITSSTTWENGTITIVGDIIVNSGITLTLNNMDIRFDPSLNLEFGILVQGALVMQGGGAQSTNANQWSFGTGSGSTVSIVGSDFANGKYDFSASIADIGSSVFRDTDSTDGQHMWIGANSNFHDNELLNIALSEDAGIVVWKNWGDTRIWGNELHLKCYGANCMGIEVIGMHEAQVSLYPGFPVVEVAWNNITWEEIAAGTDSAALDHEFSRRLYVHNNTQYVNAAGLAPGEAVTEPLEMGGPLDSIFENNTFYGPSHFGIYHYIYSNGNNLVQYNRFYDVSWGGIFQTGGSTYRYNEFVNVSEAGIWICPNSPCAGSSTSVNLKFYGNSFEYLPGANLVTANPSNMFDNILIQHGNNLISGWSNGGPVLGDGPWLYWANANIDSLKFINETDGTRRVVMTVGGRAFDSVFEGFGATDNASLTISGAIDREGSANVNGNGDGTFLWELGRTTTDVDVRATGDVTFTVENYYANATYDVYVDGVAALSFPTDGVGGGSFVVNFAIQHKVVIRGMGETSPDDPPNASFAFFPGQPFVGENISFDASLSSDDNGIVSYEWDFGNGDIAQGQIVTYAYAAEGNYNVTLTVWDGAGNSDSTVSLVQVATPPPPQDQTAPAQVTDLEAVAVNLDSVVLQWSAPGDDGDVGQASAYEVRYSTTGPLDEVNFGNATPVQVNVPTPGSAGTGESLNVTSLSPGTDYWFALRAADEVQNWSPVSNSVSATTGEIPPEIDRTPPTVTISSPDQGSVVSGTVLVVVVASDNTKVDQVVILLDGSLVIAFNKGPYLWTWSTATTAPGPHTLRAEASDPAKNVGSDEVHVLVQAPGITPVSDPPIVESIIYDPSDGRFDIRFSSPMNRSSVVQALSIEPRIAYQTGWSDDSNLTVSLQEASQPDFAYTLSIVESAADTEGTTLAKTFTFGFTGIASSADSGLVPDIWLPVSLLLTVGLIAVTGLHLWSRRGTQVMRRDLKQLATRLEELNHLSQARIYRELADLEGLVSESAHVADGRPAHLSRAR